MATYQQNGAHIVLFPYGDHAAISNYRPISKNFREDHF